jgi:ribonuclease P protein component
MSASKFHRELRLKSRKQISGLFESGKTFNAFPVKGIWLTLKKEETLPLQVAFTVPKRNFKRAVDRNLLKRRMREAFRLNKTHLEQHCLKENICSDIMFVYTSKTITDYKIIEKGIKTLLKEISGDVKKTSI